MNALLLRLAPAAFGLLAPIFAFAAPDEPTVEVRGPATQRVWVAESPVVTGDQYAITGRVSYEGVEGEGYLEMWSVFSDGARYFSRTLAEAGALGALTGTSVERAFALPFSLTPGAPRPVRLEVNVVLPASGHVTLSGLRLESKAGAMSAPGGWWSPETAGWIGAAAGSAVGMLGALVGTLCSLGRGRRLVMAGLLALGVSGLALLAVGVAALALGQPYEVWYPLLLMGVLAPVLAFSLLPAARRRFEALELRRMRSLDARE
jgi:hypothetical protein